MQEEAARAQEETVKAVEKIESSVKKFIQLGQQRGQSFQETQQTMQNIFSMSEVEAEEKMKEYWKSNCEV